MLSLAPFVLFWFVLFFVSLFVLFCFLSLSVFLFVCVGFGMFVFFFLGGGLVWSGFVCLFVCLVGWLVGCFVVSLFGSLVVCVCLVVLVCVCCEAEGNLCAVQAEPKSNYTQLLCSCH